jgi:hypothetical protein
METDPGTARPHLRGMPVVVLADTALADTVRAGARRAGGAPPVIVVPLGDVATLLAAQEAGSEIVLVLCRGRAAGSALNTARSLGGRGLPVLGLRTSAGLPRVDDRTLALLADPALLDVNVPVPSIEDTRSRAAVWDGLRGAGVEGRHHLVEVDGVPALEELAALGLDEPADRWAALAAGAAGVLAGRLVAGDRRWRAQLNPSEDLQRPHRARPM